MEMPDVIVVCLKSDDLKYNIIGIITKTFKSETDKKKYVRRLIKSENLPKNIELKPWYRFFDSPNAAKEWVKNGDA